MIEIYAHGVGTSCNGNNYHHDVWHAVEYGVTLCGVELTRHNWFWQPYTLLEVYDTPVKYRKLLEIYHCQKCARKMRDFRTG